MGWTAANPVSIGDPTKKDHYDKLWDNAAFLYAFLNSCNLTDTYVLVGNGSGAIEASNVLMISGGAAAFGGVVTNTSQPAFLVTPSGDQLNIAVTTAVTVVFGTEIFDQNGDFAANTFTAPVDGRYQLSLLIELKSIDTVSEYYSVRIETSNRSYLFVIDPRKFSSDPAVWSFTIPILADMDVADTAYVIVYQNSGDQQTDIEADNTFFSGFLAC